MAEQGYSYVDILKHYYTGIDVEEGTPYPGKQIEYGINKGVADKLKSKLEEKGIEVYLTDPSDDPTARASYTNNLKPDIFVSLHCNALEGFDKDGKPIGTARGTEAWIYDDTDSEEQAIDEFELAVRTVKSLSEEIGKFSNGFLGQLRFCRCKYPYSCEDRQLVPGLKEKCSPWQATKGIPLLQSVTVCPAILVEMEFYDYSGEVIYKGIPYPNMLELMNTEIWREDAAQGIANGIIGYFEWRGLTYTAKSPVDIIVTDPDGLRISKQLNEIPGATYIEIDLDGDGDLDDQIRIPDRKIGDYIITVIPEPDALPTDTYTLEVSLFGESIIIAENVQISDIPAQPYTVISTETGIIPPIIQATIDFDPDTLNLKSKGTVVTVYIELPTGYDVSQIDVSSIKLNGTVPALAKPTEIGDYDGDGIPELMVKFDRASVIMLFDGKTVPGNYVIEVTGTWEGIRFKGTATIKVISPP